MAGIALVARAVFQKAAGNQEKGEGRQKKKTWVGDGNDANDSWPGELVAWLDGQGRWQDSWGLSLGLVQVAKAQCIPKRQSSILTRGGTKEWKE